jgi:predicted metal-dependent hydrolase
MDFLTASGQSVPVEVKRRKGARHLKLTLGFQNQILASAPWHSSDQGILKFVEKQREWIEARLAEAPKACTILEWFEESPFITASGDRMEVKISRKDSGHSDYSFELGGAVLVFRLRESSEVELRKIVRKFAKDALTCRVYYHAKRLGLEFSTLTVRDQVSRWGSCSARRGISLNWRLVLLPAALQDYIILHELAHLSEMNHSAKFWSLLDQYDPKRVAHEVELSEIGSKYMRIARGIG